MRAASERIFAVLKKPFFALVLRQMGQKNTFFEKQTGEVAENKQEWPKNKPEQTGKQSGEVVENTFVWKKQTENKPENKAGHVVENKGAPKTGPVKRLS